MSYQASLSMEFSRQEYWSGLPFSSPGNLSDPGTELRSSALQADSLPSEPPGKPELTSSLYKFYSITLSNLQSTVLFIYCIHWVLSPSSPIKYKNLQKYKRKWLLSAVFTELFPAPRTVPHSWQTDSLKIVTDQWIMILLRLIDLTKIIYFQ